VLPKKTVFHNGQFFAVYAVRASGQLVSRISRFRVITDPDVADPASEVRLLEFAVPYGFQRGLVSARRERRLAAI
jgi:hypothetical protein